jgi:hypothetical protein
MRGMILPERFAQKPIYGAFAADAVRRAGLVRQPSLLELMSLTDWRRFVPETLGLLLAIALIRGMMDESLPGASSMPHAFWIPVLLMAAHYGIMGGLFAACSTGLLFFTTELPAQSALQDFYEYAALAAAQPCTWFAAALGLGGLRTLHIHHKVRLENQLEEIKATAEELAEQVTEAVREMALLEQRIAADTTTATALLDAFAEVDLSSRQTLLASLADIFRHGAGVDSFSVYLRDGDEFEPCFGIEEGAPIPHAALASLPRLPSGPFRRSGADKVAAGKAPPYLPLQVPILMPKATEPIGFVVCNRIVPDQIPIIAARRLNEVCRVLAKLLVVCPEAVPGTSEA